jgi:hypothetical protein
MKTEARKKFYHGYVLNEQELRRIVDTAIQQIRKLNTPSEPKIRFELKFRNGTLTNSTSVDDILSLENVGPKQIVRLSIDITDGTEPDNPPEHTETTHSGIHVHFFNPRDDDDWSRSAAYVVKGEERDWVLVTASELEERIAKVKSFSVDRFLTRRGSSLLVPIFLLTFAALMFAGMVRVATQRRSASESIEERWKAGTLHDSIEALIILQKDFDAPKKLDDPALFLRWAIAYPIAATLVLFLIGPFMNYLYIPYVFAWGDYTKVFERRVQIRKYVFSGIVGALIVGVIASVIANKITLGR